FFETGCVTDALVAFGALTVATFGDAEVLGCTFGDAEVLGCSRSTIRARCCGISGPGVEQLTVVMRIIRVGTVAQLKRSLLPPRPRRSTRMPFSILPGANVFRWEWFRRAPRW